MLQQYAWSRLTDASFGCAFPSYLRGPVFCSPRIEAIVSEAFDNFYLSVLSHVEIVYKRRPQPLPSTSSSFQYSLTCLSFDQTTCLK